ncbi:hypothetical protein J3D55_001834 [Chryseobacterium ginsenosidimutans]|nr:hypothetical protein [Chryseobacterium ginsenosidimutans]
MKESFKIYLTLFRYKLDLKTKKATPKEWLNIIK